MGPRQWSFGRVVAYAALLATGLGGAKWLWARRGMGEVAAT